jgi:hypothetical protein
VKTFLLAIGGLALGAACSEPASMADANTRPDAPVLLIDAGPKTYEQFEDFDRVGCDDDGSLGSFAFLGKWENVPEDGSDPFDSYFTMGESEIEGILDLIPADIVHVDADNLFLHRRYNLTSLAVNLCAVVDADTLFGHMAKCNGLACTTGTLEATLVEPITQ